MSRRRRRDTGGFSCFFIAQKRGQIEDMFGLCGQGARLRFNGPGCACAPFSPGFGSACSALLSQTRWVGRWRFQWAGVVRVLFARRLAQLTLCFEPNAWGGPVAVSMAGVARVPFCPAFGSACSALLGRTHGAGRWRFNGPGLQALAKDIFPPLLPGSKTAHRKVFRSMRFSL